MTITGVIDEINTRKTTKGDEVNDVIIKGLKISFFRLGDAKKGDTVEAAYRQNGKYFNGQGIKVIAKKAPEPPLEGQTKVPQFLPRTAEDDINKLDTQSYTYYACVLLQNKENVTETDLYMAATMAKNVQTRLQNELVKAKKE